MLISGCGVPKDSAVRADFIREHPDYTVLFVGVGEGDGSAAYFHIRYKRPGDPTEHEDVWQSLNTDKGPWIVNHKQTLR
jgi:hypothetical protein